MQSNRATLFAYGALAAVLLSVMPIHVQAATTDDTSVNQLRRELAAQSRRLAVQERALKEQGKQLAAYKRLLEKTIKEQHHVDALQAQRTETAGRPETQAATSSATTSPAPAPSVARSEAVTPVVVGRAPERPKESRPPPVAPISDQFSLLTPRGRFVLEPSIQYSYSTASTVELVGYTIPSAITIGFINISSINRSTFVNSLTARYGVTDRLEVEGVLPFVSRRDTAITRPLATPSTAESAFNASGNGIGDVKFSVRYQLNDGHGDSPYYIGSLLFKTHTGKDPFEVPYDPATNLPKTLPTGSGFYSLQPGLTVIYPSDPAVFFGGVSYAWNIKRDVNRTLNTLTPTFIGTVDPGDSLSFNFGMGLAMNEKASFSMGYQHSIVGKDDIANIEDPLASTIQLGNLLLGYSYSGKTNFNFLLGIGVTRESPDVQLTLRVPVLF